MNKFIVAAIQLDSQDDKKKNLETAAEFIKEAAARGAKLVALPETMNYIGPDYIQNAEPIPGPTTNFFAELAVKLGIWIHCGSIPEMDDRDKPYNTTALISPKGEIVAKYRKLHMFDVEIENGPSYKESNDNAPGQEIVLAKTELATLGFSICYDIRFGEIYRLMALNGAQIIFTPACFTMNTGKDHWEPILRARAIENACYVVSPGQIGIKPKLQAYGKTLIIDPWGNVIAKASDRPGYICAEIDLDMIDAVRAQVPALKNRRTDIYSAASDKIKVYECSPVRR